MTEIEYLKQAKKDTYALWLSLGKRLEDVCPHTKWLHMEAGSQCEGCYTICFHPPHALLTDEDRYPHCTICGKDIEPTELPEAHN